MKRFIFCILLISLNFRSLCQEIKLSETIKNIAEEVAAIESDPEAAAIYIESLNELAENPVKINSSGEEEISRLFFLSDFQVKALADYAHSSGKIISVYEIANIPGFDRETCEMMIPFISLSNMLSISPDSAKWRHTLITNICDKTGSNEPSYLGSPIKILTKYKFTSGGLSGGITFEKDPGEKLISGDPPLPDFVSAYIAYTSRGLIRKIIIGDFSGRFGQGTNINTSIRTGLSLIAPGYMASRNEIRPYTSADENNYFRGAATEFAIKNIGLTLFCSKNFLDASIISNSDDSLNYIHSFYVSGIHNSSSSIQKKNGVADLTYGINLTFNSSNVRIGFSWSEDKLSIPVIRTENEPKEVFDFNGDKNTVYSLYYNSLIKKILVFGEISLNQSLSHAIVQGLSFRPSDRLSLNFLLRDYEPGYISFHGRGPGIRSETGNERGILGNFNFEAAKHLFITGGVDIHTFPWLQYRCSAPARGIKKELAARFLPNEKLKIEALYNYRLSMNDDVNTKMIPEQRDIITRSIRGSVRYSVHDNLILGTRIDYKVSDPAGSRGILLFNDAIYTFKPVPITFWMRYCIFNTDSWDSRIYTYENDLLYSFSIPALSGEGSRSYIMLKWEISDYAEIRLKYIASSLHESRYAIKTTDEIRFQLKVFF